MNDFVGVIMAGGTGQRFWPLSTAERPKQFLDLEGCGRSLLQTTFDRLLPLAEHTEQLFVVTRASYAELVAQQLPELPPENLLLEPTGRDTAPAIGFAMLEVKRRFGNPVVGMFPSDHRVGNVRAFSAAIVCAVELAKRSRGLVTLGVQPDRPATGYGYIERGEAVGGGYWVNRFVEKPTLVRAQDYLSTGRFSWNSGIFVWHTNVILDELARHAPSLYEPLVAAHRAGKLSEVFPSLPKISIDYAVLEKTEQAYVIPAEFDWDDLGDWRALERLDDKKQDPLNIVIGQHVGRDTFNTTVYADGAGDLIVTLGVQDLVVVKRGDTVLLVHKDRVQDMKALLTDERLTGHTVPKPSELRRVAPLGAD